jgi:hypothetical protein
MAILQSTSITGSLGVTGSLNIVGGITGNSIISGSLGVTGSVGLFDKSLLIGTNVGNSPSSGFNSTWEFRTGPSIYDTELVFRPNGNAGGYNNNYWGSIRWSTSGTQGLHLLAGNYVNDIYLGTASPGSTTVRRWVRLSSTGFRIGPSESTFSLAAAEARLHVDGATKLNGNTIITGSNSLASSYALRAVNSSGTNVLSVENNGNVSINGNFNIISPSKNRNSVNVTDSEIKFLLGDNSNDNQAITITRDGSTSTDVVALKVGSDIKIKRNGGGTPTFDINNAGFVYTQNYNGNSVTNSNPFNNGAGMGVRNATQGSPVILSLLINGVFGAGNSAGSTLNICNPNGFSSGEGVGLYNLDQAVYFRNTSLFQVSQGPQSGSNAKDIIRNQVTNTDSITDFRHGLQLSSTPNVGVSSNNGRAIATNGSPIIDVTAAGVTMRGFLKVGQVVYIHEGWTTSILNSAKPKFYTITNIDLGNGTFTINSNWTGATGNVSCWLEDTISVIRNYNGDERFRFFGDGTLRTQSNLISLGYITASTYYGDGSNLTGINTGSWNGIFTGSAQITGSLTVQSSEINFTNLPTSDPNIAGRLFQTSSEAIGASAGFQVVCISQG